MSEKETPKTAVRHAKLKASLPCEVDSAHMKSKDPDTISIASRSSSNFSIERYLSTPVDRLADKQTIQTIDLRSG